MKLPKKINPDNLKDTIIQILFDAKIPSELFLGVFSTTFSDTLKFTAASPKSQEIKLEGNQFVFSPLEKGFFLDNTETIKVNITSNSIVFNTYDKYIGWDKFFPVISTIIEKLFSSNLIEEINRIGVRYISQFDQTSLIDNLKIKLSIDIDTPNKNLEATQLRTEFVDNDFRVILTLINRINQLQGEVQKDLNTSIIDIDVIQLPTNMNNSKAAIQAIENGHQKQKTTFFSLLKPAFLETLNPEY